jgi:hypothetical protein
MRVEMLSPSNPPSRIALPRCRSVRSSAPAGRSSVLAFWRVPYPHFEGAVMRAQPSPLGGFGQAQGYLST